MGCFFVLIHIFRKMHKGMTPIGCACSMMSACVDVRSEYQILDNQVEDSSLGTASAPSISNPQLSIALCLGLCPHEVSSTHRSRSNGTVHLSASSWLPYFVVSWVSFLGDTLTVSITIWNSPTNLQLVLPKTMRDKSRDATGQLLGPLIEGAEHILLFLWHALYLTVLWHHAEDVSGSPFFLMWSLTGGQFLDAGVLWSTLNLQLLLYLPHLPQRLEWDFGTRWGWEQPLQIRNFIPVIV